MEKQKIKSIEKGWGEGSTFFSTDIQVSKRYFVEEIKEDIKNVGPGLITVYRGYIEERLVFEMGASVDITVVYW